MAGFDQRCPHCSVVMNDLYGKWQDHDCQSTFFTDCHWCQKSVEIIVHSVPEFETAKPMCAKCHRVEVAGETYCKSCLKMLAEKS